MGGHRQEVRGILFASARRYVLERHGEDAFARVLAAMSDEHRPTLSSPETHAFYPEQAVREMLHAVHAELAGGDDEAFARIVHDASAIGIHGFLQVVLRIGGTKAVLERMPLLWGYMRRGPATLEVTEQSDRVRLHYRDFPFFDDPLYARLIKGMVGATVEAASGYVPPIAVVRGGADSLVLEVKT